MRILRFYALGDNLHVYRPGIGTGGLHRMACDISNLSSCITGPPRFARQILPEPDRQLANLGQIGSSPFGGELRENRGVTPEGAGGSLNISA